MERKFWWTAIQLLMSATILTVAGVTAYAHDALQRPNELQYWDASRACNGYTLFGARGTTYLLPET